MKKAIRNLKNCIVRSYYRAQPVLADRSGDLATNTIGSIIVAVVVVGLLITAVNAFFPGFFSNMFDSMAEKLNSNW